jgi:cytochrome P450
MTLFLAGHETTANALSWTVYLLTQHPEIAERLAHDCRCADYHESSAGTGSRLRDPSPAVGDEGPSVVEQAGRSAGDPESEFGLKEDSLLFRVIRESLRLYPPVWAVGRKPMNPVRIGGNTVPKGSIVLSCQWAMHRCHRYFPNPTRFEPDRWTADFQRTLPKYAFFPFGGGPRSCIGEGFAWMELGIVLTELLRRWRFELAPGQTIKPKASVTLRSEKPIQVVVR